MKNDRQSKVSLASLYQRCEKYNMMISIAKELISEDKNLTDIEMAVFVEGYKNRLNQIRKPLVQLKEIEIKEIKRGSTHAHLLKELIIPKISELSNLCDDFISQVDILLQNPKNFDLMAYLSRLKLDYLRYKCQFIERGEEWNQAHDEFFNTIKKIEMIKNGYLPSNNIHILYIELGKCIFYYEVLNKPKEAIDMGKIILKSILDTPIPSKPVEQKEVNKEEEKKDNVEGGGEEKKDENNEKKVNEGEQKKEEEEKKEEKKEGEEKKEQNLEENKKEEEEKKVEKEEKKEKALPADNRVFLPQDIRQFIYILKTNIILWSGKHETDVKL